jgi:hypothetical protein
VPSCSGLGVHGGTGVAALRAGNASYVYFYGRSSVMRTCCLAFSRVRLMQSKLAPPADQSRLARLTSCSGLFVSM